MPLFSGIITCWVLSYNPKLETTGDRTMTKQFTFFLVIILLFATNGLAQSKRKNASRKSASKLTIGMLDNSDSRYLQGCGCAIWSASRGPELSDHYYLLGESLSGVNNKVAYMKINRQVVKLKMTHTKNTSEKQQRKGTKFTEYYWGGDSLVVQVDYVVSKARERGGEVTKYAITITAKQGNSRGTVSAVGECGC